MKINLKLNYFLIIIPFMIFALGFITLLSSSPSRAESQLVFFVIGAMSYILFANINYKIFSYFWKYIYLFVLVILAFLFIAGVAQLGSVRWISLGLFTLQPSEIAKIALIFTMSAYIASIPDFKTNIKKQLYLIVLTVPVVLMVFIQPDLGTSLVLIGIIVLILLFSGISKVYFLVAFIIVGLLSNPLWNSLKDYQKIRVLVFLNPQLDVLGHGYNVIQSLITIGSGGVLGKGFGHGSQTQMNFLPVHWTDFIFASFAEEWGFVGVAALVILYLMLLLYLLRMILVIKDPLGVLILVGIFSTFFTQFLINTGMNTGLLPVTGITLPLVSYGGSSLITTMSMLGITQNIWNSERQGKL